MKDAAFQCVAVPDYPDKPRNSGITMIIEYGLGLHYQKGLIETAGWFIDLVKFGTGLSRILPHEVLKQKIQLYKANGVNCFPGGQFFELAYLQDRVEAYLEEVKSLGFSHAEISENCIDLSPEKKAEIIRRAIREGLTVLGETGKKLEKSAADDLVRDLQNCLEAGAWKVFVEAAELLQDGEMNVPMIEAITRKVDINSMIFEIPGQWMKGMTFSNQYGLWKLLIHKLGPEVNLGNIQAEEIMRLSLMRLGLGADTTLEKGAFVMTQRGLLP